MIPEFLKSNPRLALYAFFAVAASGFGQTFFVSVMGGAFREAFGLSHTAYGSLYSAGTLVGFPLAEACLPAGAVFIMEGMGWRWAWLAGLAVLLLGVFPLLAVLSRKTPAPQHDARMTGTESSASFTRSQVLRDPGFYLILPATLSTPFVITALFFHQVAIAELQGWSLQLLAKAFSGYAVGHLMALFLAGPVVDRLGAGRTLPMALWPLIAGLVLLGLAKGPWVALVYLLLLGIDQGFAATAGGAVWAERYGVVHLGAIRAMTQAIMVVSTAIAPVLLGFFLDLGLGGTGLGLSLAAGVLGASCLAWLALNIRQA